MKRQLLAFVCVVISVAANGQTPKSTQPSVDIERRVRMLEFQMKSIERRISHRFAELDCNSGKYDEFMFDTGALVFFAACTKIEPYLEGHKITISIGNPHAFNFSNVKGELRYGKDVFDSIERKVEVSMTESIRAGTWNTIMVTVNPSKAEDLRYLGLTLNAATASATR